MFKKILTVVALTMAAVFLPMVAFGALDIPTGAAFSQFVFAAFGLFGFAAGVRRAIHS
jgi:hypothetical protein